MATVRLALTIVALTFGITYAAPQGQTPPRDARSQPVARQIPVGTAVISGVVISADTGSPVRNARVSLNGSAGVIPAGRGIEPPAPNNPQPPTLSISRTAYTDAQGQFAFARMAAGRYSVSVNRDGYLPWGSGQRRPNTGAFPTIELADDARRTLAISLSRGGAIGGRVTDEDGEPARNVQIQLWRIERSGGWKRLQQTNNASTNDRGAYRLFGLQPGSYMVSAVPRVTDFMPDTMLADIAAVEQAIASGRVQTPASGPAFVIAPPVQAIGSVGPLRVPTYLPVYFPGALTPSAAQVITIAGSEERDGVDIALVHARASTIRGTISPQPPSGTSVQVTLISADTFAGNASYASFNQDDGTFMMNNVAPGRYTLVAQTSPGTRTIEPARVLVDGKPLDAGVRINVSRAPQANADAATRLWAHADVIVTDNATVDVSLTLRPALTVSGSISFDMTRSPNLQGGQSLQLVPIPGVQTAQNPQSSMGPDGTFTIKGVLPGRYFLRMPWTVRSATLSGQDVFEVPFDVLGDRNLTGLQVTVTDKTTEVVGTLTDSSDNPLGNRLVVIAPVDQRYWVPGSRRILTTNTGPYGRYTFRVPPGDYVVSPAEDFENGAEYDPEFLAALSGTGSRVTVTEGSSVRQDFRAQ